MNPHVMRKECATSSSSEASGNGQALDASTAGRARKEAMRLDEREWQDRCHGSRAELAESLTHLSRRRISEATLTKWLSLSSDRQMPATLEQAWAAVTGSMRIKQVGAEALGGRFVTAVEVAMIGLARADLQMCAWREMRDRTRQNIRLEYADAADAA